MSLLDKFNNPKKNKITSEKKLSLETDFSNGEDSDAWFVAWELHAEGYPDRRNRVIREVGSEIFAFPKKMSPKDILQQVKICLKFHLRPWSAPSQKITDAQIAANPNAALLRDIIESQEAQADPDIHITQFSKL